MRRKSKLEADTQPVSHDPNIKKQVFLRSGDVPGILQWATATLEPGTTVTEHQHDDASEIFQIIVGRITGTIEGNSYDLAEGDLLVVEPGEKHAFENSSNEACTMIYALLLTA